MSLQRTIAPTAQPVTLAEAKVHLKVDHADEDTLITMMIAAATQAAEHSIGRVLMAQGWKLTLDAFPEAFELTKVPVNSVTSVQYTDINGTLQTLASNLYTLDNADDTGYAYLLPAYSTEWPDSREQANAVAVTYTAGYANAAAVPELVRFWILLQVGSMYENRSAENKMQTYALGFADRLLDRYKIWG